MPRVPHWVKVLVILACIGLAGALTGCGGARAAVYPELALQQEMGQRFTHTLNARIITIND